MLASSKTVTRSRVVSAPPSEVFALLKSSRGYQAFNPYCDTDPNLHITHFGPNEGVGSGFRFAGKEGKGTQTIARLVPNKEVVVDIDLGAMGQPVTTFSLTPRGDRTEVVWSTKAEFGMNPIKRVFGLFLDGMLGKVYERGLENLERSLLPKGAN